jgi:translation initiation factor 4E
VPWPLKYTWTVWYRPPTAKNVDYEKSIVSLCKFGTAQEFWKVFSHLKRPSSLPSVSDYHVFKQGIRPVWEDEENKRGGKWIMRLKKGVADRYWEDLLMALVGDQFMDAGEEFCGFVLSVRSGEDVFSIWTKSDGVKNVKIRDTIKRALKLPEGTNIGTTLSQFPHLEGRSSREGRTILCRAVSPLAWPSLLLYNADLYPSMAQSRRQYSTTVGH